MYTLAPISRYCSAWEIPIITPGGMIEAFRSKQGPEGFSTLTRMLGSYGEMGYALNGILSEFNWHTGYMVYDEIQDKERGNSVCSFRMKPILRYLQRTDTQKSYFAPFDEMRTTRPQLLEIMERVKQNSRSRCKVGWGKGFYMYMVR